MSTKIVSKLGLGSESHKKLKWACIDYRLKGSHQILYMVNESWICFFFSYELRINFNFKPLDKISPPSLVGYF
ncbi:hypothetical protein HanPSC8_Chr12g0540291 [Helianthus annuus]|nr:hypothetical protein HanPSC8_Chr12g0540291 [Helianthus annuus]